MLGSSLFADCLVSEVEYRGVKRFTFRELESNSFYLGLFYERSFISAGEKGGWHGGPRGSAPRRTGFRWKAKVRSAAPDPSSAHILLPLERHFARIPPLRRIGFQRNAFLRGLLP